MRFMFMVAAVATMLAACASTSPAAGTKVASADGTKPASESGKICKRMMSTGSNMPTRVCSTKEEWDQIDKQGQEGVEDFERARSNMNSAGPGLGN